MKSLLIFEESTVEQLLQYTVFAKNRINSLNLEYDCHELNPDEDQKNLARIDQ